MAVGLRRFNEEASRSTIACLGNGATPHGVVRSETTGRPEFAPKI